MSCQNQQAEAIRAQIQAKYSHLTEEEVQECYDNAIADYVMRRYPSSNNRPPIERLSLDFYEMQKVKDRMEEILDMVGGKNVQVYKENGITFQYYDKGYSLALSNVMPKASAPR
jgi:hypothetical protein